MQQLPSAAQPDPGNLTASLHDLLGTLLRGWRLIAVCVAITLTLAVIYLARAKPIYNASARLLVLHQGGRPISIAHDTYTQDSLMQLSDGSSNSLTTHLMVIRSPLILGRALALAGRDDLSARWVMMGLTAKLPEPTARVIELGYRAGTQDEAVRILDAVIKSYDLFLQENYQKKSSEVLDLITKARDELGADLKRLEADYLEFRQKGAAHPPGGDGKTFVSRRLDQWDQAISQAMLRSLQLKSQLDLGRRLAEDGAGVDLINRALGHLGGASISPAAAPAPAYADPGASLGLPSNRLEAELGEIQFQRQTAESELEHLRDERAKASSAARARVDQSEVIREFYAMPAVAECAADLQEIRGRYDRAKAISRRSDEASFVALGKQMRSLEAELGRLWQQYRPVIENRLAGGDEGQAIRQAEGKVIGLRAKEAALRERLDQSKADRLLDLRARRDRLVQRHGPRHEKVQEIEGQIARLDRDANESPADPRQAQADALLSSIEQGLKSVDAMRAEVEQRFQHDLAESNKSEIGLLAESNLRNNLDRQRALFFSVVDQLKQAQLASDFGSVTAQVLDPPTAMENRPLVPVVLLAALVLGCGLGAGTVYLANQFDARIRSLPEFRRLLEFRMLGAVPLLSPALDDDVPIGLISHRKPQSRVAEIYKSIRTGIDLIRRNWEGKVIMVSSPQPADGKSMIASNLAICTAQSGRRVLLIDADLRRPSQHRIHRRHRGPGLTQVLAGEIAFHRVVQSTEVENLDLLTAGAEVPHPAELLATERLGALVGELRQAYDLVIIDTSPLLVVTDPSIVAVAIDGIVLVVRASATRRFDAERSQDLLRILEIPVLGLIINGVGPEQRGYGYGDLLRYGAYGRAASSGDGEDTDQGSPSERVDGRRGLPGVGPNSTDYRPPVDS
jgi:capsular exopolysaccharide synthesis family protein